MLEFTATAYAAAIANAANNANYHVAWYGEFTGNKYPTPARLASALMDAMAERVGIGDTPAEIRSVGVAIVDGDGSTRHQEDIDTYEIPGYGDGIMHTWGQLYIAVADVVRFMPATDEKPFILRLAMDTYTGVDDIEAVAVIAWDATSRVYRIDSVAMMRYDW